jgi:sugar lactone lactonase YvrE
MNNSFKRRGVFPSRNMICFLGGAVAVATFALRAVAADMPVTNAEPDRVSAEKSAAFRRIPVGPSPESITRGFDGDFFVTLMGTSRKKGDQDGRIVRLHDGKVSEFATGLDDPKGLVFVGGALITADFDQVWRVDADGKKTLLAGPKDFPTPPLYLNDVAIAPDGKGVLVTEMGAAAKMRSPDDKLWPLDSPEGRDLPKLGRIYRIGVTGGVTIAADLDPLLVCPNGIFAPDDKTLLVAEFFTGKILERMSGGWRVVATGHRGADGIARGRDGTIYVSETLTGNVWAIYSDGHETLLATLSSAADFFLDENAHELLVPDIKAGAIVIVPIRENVPSPAKK